MFSEIEKIIKIHKDTGMILEELEEYETGENVDYSDIITDLLWNKDMLQIRLNSLKIKERLNSEESIDEVM